ncbi:para-nitrobenzyl esterase [Actinokineospora alba]|uniref:Carboxylic ester hydrolase n=1 Tax=Actinokineospora alba TaxID=504798 RepID=A0A1H0LTE5_9PSEU|nr:carboxylesterase family protein [Actinokineospora alba]TDP67447.1 carboxylesterase type B [Actinokineospora alba]SDI96327.1 para-nitrobenzyl esterase [Actinokineospora alba]SDO71375.1 para-nitrobenzyl esterase [Actinokineospora alba]
MRRARLNAVLAAAVVAVGLAGVQPAVAAGPAGPVVATEAGPLRGAAAATTDQYLGVPFAAPPVGELRWQPPRPVARWTGVREATQLSARCVQKTTAVTSEDCLYLNVHTPKGAARGGRFPVMVWFHGGSLVSGMGGSYDPTAMVERGTVVVTVNYRLGALGFLAHPALAAADGSAGNYGLMDQQAALRWVQRNIGQFGGRADEVTIFGESAGGLSVLAHLAAPGSAGLFAGAISQSGAFNLKLQSLADAKTEGSALGAAAGCPDQTAQCLRSLPASALVAKQKTIVFLQTDGAVLPRSLDEAFRSGRFNQVPVVNGTTHDESTWFVAAWYELVGRQVTAENFVAGIQVMTGVSAETAGQAAQRYPLADYPSPAAALSAVATDASFACPALKLDGWLSPHVPTYAYEFDDRNAPQIFLPKVSFAYGAYHASELQYLFKLTNAVFPTALSAEQEALAMMMRRHWTDFAKSGRPAAEWPTFSAADQRMITYVPSATSVRGGFSADHRCDFWNGLG